MWSLGVKLDGRDPKEFGLIFLQDHYHPMTPEIRSKTLAIPGMSGEWDFGSERGPKPFNLPFGIIEYDRFKKQRKLNDFVAFLFDVYGSPRSIKLSFNYEPDKYYNVKLKSRIDPERLYHSAKFDVPFIAHKPERKFMLPSNEITMGSRIPIMSHIMWGTGVSNRAITRTQTFMIANNGTLSIPFAFRLEGSGSNVSVSVNGKTMTLGSFSNKVFEITDNYVVKVNGVTDLTSTNGVLLELLPGMNEITVSGTNLNLSISEKLTYQYV